MTWEPLPLNEDQLKKWLFRASGSILEGQYLFKASVLGSCPPLQTLQVSGMLRLLRPG